MQRTKKQRQKQLIIRMIIGVFMLLFIFIVSSLLVALLLGYRFNGERLEQTGLVQFETRPGGATVEVDGVALSGKTTTKATVRPGLREFVMWREGYETWRKSLSIEPGTLTALTYPRLIPKQRPVEAVAQLDAVVASRFSNQGQYVLAQTSVNSPSFQLYDLREETVRPTTLTLPDSVYASPDKPDATHQFTLGNWDASGRYMSLQHTSDGASQWIILDRENPEQAVNVTKLFNLPFEAPVFAGTSGNVLYVLSSGEIRKLDLRASTISRPLVSGVRSFKLYENNTIMYTNVVEVEGKTQTNVGYAREDDDQPVVFATFDSSVDPASVFVAASKYYNQQYISYTAGTTLTVLTGSLPSASDTSTMRTYGTVLLAKPATQLLVNQGGDAVVAQSGDSFVSFDIERKTSSQPGFIDGTAAVDKLTWLDGHLLWSDRNGKFVLREFDGANKHSMGDVIAGQDASLVRGGQYLYSFGKNDAGVQLQRVRLVLN